MSRAAHQCDNGIIPSIVLSEEPRLQRLFALAGKYLDQGETDDEALTEVLFEIAPEFVPPHEPENMAEWEGMIDGIL